MLAYLDSDPGTDAEAYAATVAAGYVTFERQIDTTWR